LHGLDIDCLARQEDGYFLTHGDGVTGLGEPQMFLEGERQIVGLIKPPGMQWQPQIFDAECGDLGPKLLGLVCRGLRGECHVDSCCR
jgi:hypothetical protein